MKLIQSFDISEGMSVNSLKPSINSGPENSLDSCIMKEASVGDCILPKEMHSQSNGQKGLCLADYEVGNATKKMFEQVDLNSSIPNSEIPHRKDSWNSGALYNKTSEKENMAEANEVRFDILSDDESESIHLKISSDEDNSNLDAEINERNTSPSKQLLNMDDDDDDDASEHVNEDLLCGIPVYGENPNYYSESDKELLNESLTEEGVQASLESSDEAEVTHVLSAESDIEDTTEEVGPIPSCSKSPEVSLSSNVENISGRMVNEVKSMPTSPLEIDSNDVVSEIRDSKIDCGEGNLSNKEKIPSLSSIEEECTSDSSQSENTRIADVESDVNLEEGNYVKAGPTISRSNNNEKHFNSESSNLANTTVQNIKERMVIADEVLKSNTSVKNVVLGNKDLYLKTEENCNNETKEGRMNCDVEQGEGEEEEFEYEDEEDTGIIKSTEVEELVRTEEYAEGKVLNENFKQRNLKALENEISVEESSNNTENKVLEILEYQPVSEEGEELSEIQLDKDLCAENHRETVHMDENHDEPLHAELCSEKEVMNNSVPSLVVNCDSDTGVSCASDGDILLVSSPESDSERVKIKEDDLASKEKSNSINEKKNLNYVESNLKEQQNMTFEHKDCSDVNRRPNDFEEKSDVELISEISSPMKMDPQAERCEAQSGRKRTSNSEENLVNSSKRTKVAILENKTDDTCDVFMCDSEQTTDSEVVSKKCVNLDTKEKCDRIKRLSSSHSDIVDAKKMRVTSGSAKDKKDEKTSLDKIDVKLDAKNNERAVESKSGCGISEKSNELNFFRNCSREQLQTMTRNDLEELVLEKICEAITERSNCGELRELAQTLEQKLKSWQKKSLQLSKQIKDLNLVLRRYGSDLQTKGPNAVPVKITRSVGLQVQMPGYSPASCVQEDSLRRKGDKVQSSSVSTSSVSTPSVSTPSVSASVNTLVKTSALSPVTKSPTNAQKVSEGSEGQGSPVSSPPQPQLNTQPTGVKAMQTRPALILNSGTATAKTSNKQSPTSVNNRVKTSSDLQVIDLTDAEDKVKNIAGRVTAVSNLPTPSPTPTVTPGTAITSIAGSVGNSSINNVGCRSIRVVQHVSGASGPLLTQSSANAVGQRVTYLVPTTTVPVQQRQLIISGSPQVRPAGVVNMTNRPSPLPTIVLKPGQVVPVSPVAGTGTNIIRTPNVNSSIQLSSRAQPRTGQIFQRISATGNPVQSSALTGVQSSGLSVSSVSHPAPLPTVPSAGPSNANWKLPPPKPDLKISKVPNRNQQGIVLSWNMIVTNEYEEIASYQLFAYQEGNAPPSTQLWKKVGDVKALPLPMACTLTQFMEGHKYHFAVRAVDVYARYGPFSAPGNIVLTRN